MKYATDRPLADPEKAARKILEIANRLRRSRTVASTSRRSMAPSCFETAAAQPSTAPAWSSRSNVAGSRCTGPALT